jgi:hypothetical protein
MSLDLRFASAAVVVDTSTLMERLQQLDFEVLFGREETSAIISYLTLEGGEFKANRLY